MINRQEVIELAREFGLDPNVVEKDYVLGWLLAGIFSQDVLRSAWVFKGGTCLKKCYFETYRFSEDLDFTITDPAHLEAGFLGTTFADVTRWVYEQSGIEIPADAVRFEVYDNPRGGRAVEGRIGYRGPMARIGSLARVKLDLTNDELLVLAPATREVHHPYSDRPADGINAQCYSYEEVFAEKIRALAERERPRDLYDVIHLYRHAGSRPDRARLLDTLEKKCTFKGIATPTMASLEGEPERAELEAEWGNMLGHQLPALPAFDQFWNELPEVFEWLHGAPEKMVPVSISVSETEEMDTAWQPPAMVTAWREQAPMEVIRFAAANRLCIELGYQRSKRIIEPYSLRRTKAGKLLLHAVKRETGETRSYRVDRIESATATGTSFVPRYAIELTPSGPMMIPRATWTGSGFASSRQSIVSSVRRSKSRSHGFGPTYVLECMYCHKRFQRKEYSTTLNPHKDKSGYRCPGRTGHLVDTRY